MAVAACGKTADRARDEVEDEDEPMSMGGFSSSTNPVTSPGSFTDGVMEGSGGFSVTGNVGLGGEAGGGGAAGQSGAPGASGPMEPIGPGGLDCLTEGGPVGIPRSCAPTVDDSCCKRCAAARCCELFGDCFATDPYNVCGALEYNHFHACMYDRLSPTPGLDPEDDFGECMVQAVEQGSAPFCGGSEPTHTFLELELCLHGDEQGEGGCFDECYDPYFDQSACSY